MTDDRMAMARRVDEALRTFFGGPGAALGATSWQEQVLAAWSWTRLGIVPTHDQLGELLAWLRTLPTDEGPPDRLHALFTAWLAAQKA